MLTKITLNNMFKIVIITVDYYQELFSQQISKYKPMATQITLTLLIRALNICELLRLNI